MTIDVQKIQDQVQNKAGIKHLKLEGFDELLGQESGWMEQYLQENPAVKVYVMANSAPTAFVYLIDSIPLNLMEWVLKFMANSSNEEASKIAQTALKYLPLVKVIIELV